MPLLHPALLSDFVARGSTDRRPTGCQCKILAPKLHMGEWPRSNQMFNVQSHNPRPMFTGDTHALFVVHVCSKNVDICAEEWQNKYHLDFQPLRWSVLIHMETEGRFRRKNKSTTNFTAVPAFRDLNLQQIARLGPLLAEVLWPSLIAVPTSRLPAWERKVWTYISPYQKHIWRLATITPVCAWRLPCKTAL